MILYFTFTDGTKGFIQAAHNPIARKSDGWIQLLGDIHTPNRRKYILVTSFVNILMKLGPVVGKLHTVQQVNITSYLGIPLHIIVFYTTTIFTKCSVIQMYIDILHSHICHLLIYGVGVNIATDILCESDGCHCKLPVSR